MAQKICACGNEIPAQLWIGNAPATVCYACQARVRAAAKVARKAELAAMPRCEADACEARGMYHCAGGVLLCGKHLKKAKAARQAHMAKIDSGMYFMALLQPLSAEDLLDFANGGAK